MVSTAVRTTFSLMQSQVNRSTGEVKYTRLFELTPANITSITIVTDAYEEVSEFGSEPTIIPLGVSSCKASITGTFDDPVAHKSSRMYPTSGLAREITDFENTIQLFTELEGMKSTYALKRFGTDTTNGCRELGAGIWKLNKFSWDRKAKENGIYRFAIDLSYFWEEPSEQKIYDDSTANKKTQTADFELDIFGTGNGQENAIASDLFNVKITKSIHVKNTASFDYRYNIVKDSIIKIHKKGGTKKEDRDIFYGLVRDSTANTDGSYTVNCLEICDLLYRGVCTDPDDALFAFLNPRAVIPTPRNGVKYKIGGMVYQMIKRYYVAREGFEMWKPGDGICRAGGLVDSEKLPGREVDIGDQVLSGLSVGKGITNFLYSQCGFYVWYDYTNNGALEYGFIRDPINIDSKKEYIEHTTLVESMEEDMKPDGVIVTCTDSSGNTYSQGAGSFGPSKHIALYIMSDTKYSSCMEAIAQGILELNNMKGRETFNVRFPAGTVRFKEGDYFQGLGDQTIFVGENKASMVYREGADADPLTKPDDSAWQIKEMTITNEYTEVLVGASFYSVTDIYRDCLNRCTDGIPAPIDDVTIRTREIRIGTNIGENINV